MEAKKISFGFSKINKRPNLLLSKESQKPETNKVELIKCLEGQEIKLVEEKAEEAPLIIPLKESQKTSAALASLIKRRAVLLGEDEAVESVTVAENGEKSTNDVAAEDTHEEDIEKRAAKELLAELNDAGSQGTASNLVLPIVHPDELPLDGAKESNMDDYDNIPIQQFGKAMLRGMGWVEPPPPSKGGPPIDDTPMVRPKGMGLGADKALKAKPLLVKPESNEVLEIKRNAYVRILGGKHKDLYGQIEGFDDHAGRVIVKMAIGGFKEAFNEFLCQPVAKKEYAQYGKCINSTKYEEYKRKENEFGQIILNKEEIAKLDKASVKYEKFKKEKKEEPSSDEDCKIVERKPIKIDLDSKEKDRESRDYYKNDKYIKNERDGKRESNRENERERNRSYNRDEERLTKRENTRNYDDKDRKRDSYRDEGKRYQDNGQNSSHDRAQESHRNSERSHDSTRDRYKDHQQSGSSNHKREGDRYRETSRDRYESRHGKDDQRRRQEDKDKNKDYEERKSRQRNNSISNESNSDDDRSQHKKYNKDKKSKKKSKKSKKSKSKHQDSSCDSDSCSSDSSDSEVEKRHKAHKKKTKKSKKQRERSRSRGRR